MSRKVWIGLTIAGLVGVLLAGGAAAGLFLYRQHQEREWLANARQYEEEGEYGVARSHYVNYLARNPRDTEVLREYIDVNLQRTDSRADALQDAITAYMQLLRYEPGDQDAQEELADLLFETESWGRLEFQMQQRLQENPDDEEARYMQAIAMDNQGRVQDAIDQYRTLMEEETDYADVYGNLAILLHERGLSSQAAEALETGEEHVGNDPEFHLAKARYHGVAREPEAAEAAYETALDLDPDNPDVLAAAASFFAEENRPNRALELVERALENEPGHVQSRITHAQVKQSRGELETARDILESLDAYERHAHPGAMIALAEIYLGLEDTDSAMEVVDEHLEGYEGQSPIREYVTGRTFLLEGEPEQAASRLANVHDQAPAFAPAQFHLIVAYLQSGRRTDARAVLESYLRRYPDEQQARLLMAAEAGTETSDEQLAELALNLLDSGSTDTGALMNSAVNLFEVGMARGEPRERLRTVEQLLERAMEHDPND
ncbi:MAG: tetratricopeptide repeat protein, partial [Candidatus Hydrogenedentota bacterium]